MRIFFAATMASTRQTPDMWLCVAHEKEIPAFRDFSKAGFTPYALGVGQFASLAELARLVSLETPAGVLLAGTCGSLNKEDLFRVFECRHFALPYIAGEELPEFLPRAVETAPAVKLDDLPRATVLQNHGLSLDPEKFMLNTGYIPQDYPKPVLENMEATSLAIFCHERRIPFMALLCVTNAIGPNGRRDWKENFRKAGEILAKTLSSL